MGKVSEYIQLVLKGIGIGSANVIPGVSGGTIALLTGIYERFLNSIKSFNLTNCRLLLQGKFKEFSKNTDLWFLMSVFAGIIISTYSLAKLLVYLLDTYPIATWAFFFGLVLVSCYYVALEIKKWNLGTIFCGILGIGIALFISFASPTQTPESWWFIMLCGAIAICAMILPGISGSFILVLLAKYEFIMNAIGNLDMTILILFIVGALIGLIAFSHLLSWLLKRYRAQTLAVLTGFMVGSLIKLWPWKRPESADATILSFPTQWGTALACAVAGIALVVLLELLANRKTPKG